MAVIHGSKAVAAAGTEEKLSATSVAIQSITIQAKRANTGFVYVGGTGISSTEGISLDAGEMCSFSVAEDGVDEPGDIWIDVDTNGEGVTFTATTRG